MAPGTAAAPETTETPAGTDRAGGLETASQVISAEESREDSCQNPDCDGVVVWVPVFEEMEPPDLCRACRKDADRGEIVRELEDRTADEPEIYGALQQCGVNVDAFPEATLENFRGDWEPGAMDVARDFLEAFRDRRRKRPWAYLHGPTGNGKSFLAAAILRELLASGDVGPDRACWVNAEMLLLRIEESYDRPDTSAFQVIERFASYELLVVDDLGVRGFHKDHPRRMVYNLANQRGGKPTIWTSNLSLADLEEQNPEMDRIVSRILEWCGPGAPFVFEFTGQDRRAAQSAGEPQSR